MTGHVSHPSYLLIDMATGFINAFRHLQRQERGQALEALATELTPYEWRALHAIVASRPFQCDIIGRLPLELVAHIFSHLDIVAPYRLQIVSKRWSRNLRSLYILKTGLDRWYQGTVNLQAADYALCMRRARAIHAFRTGNPRIVFKVVSARKTGRLMLAGNHLVWAGRKRETSSRYALVLNLDTWQLRSLRGEAREQLMDVFVSDQIVALTTFSNICYVWELQGGPGPKNFRVPSSTYFRNVACRDRTVACVAHFAKHTSVFIWEYNTQRGRSFNISHGPDDLFPELDSE